MLLNTELSLEQQEHLHTLQICSRVLLTTINDLLDLGRSSSTYTNANISRHSQIWSILLLSEAAATCIIWGWVVNMNIAVRLG